MGDPVRLADATNHIWANYSGTGVHALECQEPRHRILGIDRLLFDGHPRRRLLDPNIIQGPGNFPALLSCDGHRWHMVVLPENQ